MRVAVGAGVIGLSTAYELIHDGYDVTVLDAASVGHGPVAGSATTMALAEAAPVPAPGMVVRGLKWMLNPGSPLYIRPPLAPSFLRFMISMARHCNAADHRRGLAVHLALTADCLEILDEWRDHGISFEEHRRGILLAFEHTTSFEERRRSDEMFATYGHVPEVLDAAAVHEREPALTDIIQHGLFYADDRQVEPLSLTAALAKALERAGQTVIADVAVSGFVRSGGQITAVKTSDDRYECEAVVLAAGAYCGPLTRTLGSPMPIRPGKGYSVDYPDSPTALSTPLTFEDSHVAVTPLDGMLRVAGTMEFSGFETKVRPRRVKAMKQSAAHGLGDWDPSRSHRPAWAGMRPMTPDGLPLIGQLPGYHNAYIASGHGMLGLTLAPSTARTVRRLIRGEAVSSTIAAVSPARFEARRSQSQAIRP